MSRMNQAVAWLLLVLSFWQSSTTVRAFVVVHPQQRVPTPTRSAAARQVTCNVLKPVHPHKKRYSRWLQMSSSSSSDQHPQPESGGDEQSAYDDQYEQKEESYPPDAYEPDAQVQSEQHPAYDEAPVAAIEEGNEQEEQPQEDPELTALKQEIEQLEGTLKDKRRQVSYMKDQAEEYSKAGYARKVAEMENMRRTRSMLNSSDKFASMASTVAEFLPVLDRLDDLRAMYGEDEFGQQYNALPGSLRTAFVEMGVTEYTVQVGEAFDPARMVAVEQVQSTEFEPNKVIQPLSVGLELKGNAIRAVECVVSVAPEVPEEESAAPEMEQPTEEGDAQG